MSKVSLSFHAGNQAHRSHNIRDPRVVAKQPHIDPKGKYSVLIDIPPKEAYEELFGEATREYNARQTRPERRIKSYYAKVKRSANMVPVKEIIVGLGNSRGAQIPEEQSYAILQEYIGQWQSRNPNLKLILAAIHADERPSAVVHAHLDIISWYPVRFPKRGLSVRTGLTGALEAQGFHRNGKDYPFSQWVRSERKVLTEIAAKYGVEIEPKKEGYRRHLDKETYRLYAEHERVLSQYNQLVRNYNLLLEKSVRMGVHLAEHEYIKTQNEIEHSR